LIKLSNFLFFFLPLTSTCQSGRIGDSASHDMCQVSPLFYCVID